MSLIQEALKSASNRNVIDLPRERNRPHAFPGVVLALNGLVVLAVAFSLWTWREESRFRDAGITAEMSALHSKYDEFLVKIHTGERYLDTRMELDVLDLKSRYSAMSAQLDALKDAYGSLKAENEVLRRQLEQKAAPNA